MTRIKTTPAVLACLCLCPFGANANTLTVTIDRLQVHRVTNAGYVYLTGAPLFDGGGCSSPWATGDLDDTHFMVYFWPMLMSAKSQGKSVTISVSGCSGDYPKIEMVQINAS